MVVFAQTDRLTCEIRRRRSSKYASAACPHEQCTHSTRNHSFFVHLDASYGRYCRFKLLASLAACPSCAICMQSAQIAACPVDRGGAFSSKSSNPGGVPQLAWTQTRTRSWSLCAKKSTPLRSSLRSRSHVKEAENRAHVQACKGHDCKRCLYLRNRGTWQKRLPIVDDEFQAVDSKIGTAESWLDDRVDSKTGTWGIGCTCCEKQLQ